MGKFIYFNGKNCSQIYEYTYKLEMDTFLKEDLGPDI
jgi:hypothetical protein